MKHVIVYAEHRSGKTRKVTFEMATEARKLADALGGQAYAVALGAGAQAIAEQLKAYPLDSVFVTEDADVDRNFCSTRSWTTSSKPLAGSGLHSCWSQTHFPGATSPGASVARLGAGIGADVTDFKVEAGRVECVSPKMGGALITVCAIEPADYGIATVRPNAFAAAASGSGAAAQPLEKPTEKTYTTTG